VIKEAIERNIKAMSLQPEIAQGTAVTKVTVRDGVTCDIVDGGWTLTADEGKGDGGNGEGPDPGVFGRAALGSCLAIGYVMWAAKEGLSFSKIEVDVETDYNALGGYGLDASIDPGWPAVRYHVRIESDAPEADVLHLIDYADAHSSILDCFRRPLDVSRTVSITAPAR
jgi:uncharacterized OsmC-like protein